MKRLFALAILLVSFMFQPLTGMAQSFTNDFENQNNWLAPWLNIHIAPENDSISDNHICLCDSIHEYGFGFSINSGANFPHQNICCHYEFGFNAPDTSLNAQLVFSIENGNKPYWNALPIRKFRSDSTEWSHLALDLCFPSDYIGAGTIKCYIWNQGRNRILIDNALLEVKAETTKSYLFGIENNTTIEHTFGAYRFIPIIEYINTEGDTLRDLSVARTNFTFDAKGGNLTVTTETVFNTDLKLLRLAVVMPLPDGKLTVYRRNQHIDTIAFQPSYYLDREGFTIENDSLTLSTYHNTGISSLQLDTRTRFACFNIDYWRDHPLVHFPLLPDTSDVFEDISYRNIKKNEVLSGKFTLFINKNLQEIPRLMPVWEGYQSAFIFTEHADWTNLRTQRAVLFGNEHITNPEDAVGGFCHFNIPVTKSVFYWNPDQVTNAKTSNGRFTELVASIKTDNEFYKLLRAIKKKGFEICLHSPEIYTTIPAEFPKAMRFMRRHFGSKSWIDHGYNNGPDKNREDLVCDGLIPNSPHYAAELWRKNGVRYLWNAYYEENRMESLNFDGHFVQPYDGFGDALPNRQITTLPDGNKDFLLWATPSTLEVNEDHEWYYYFDSIRLQRLVDQHNVFITHIYPAWADPWRGMWQSNGNGSLVAMPGLNFALSQLARFRDKKKILPTTIDQYLGFYEKLLNIEYNILNDNSIQLTNHGPAIHGLTLLCTSPIIVEGKVIDFRKVDEGYLVWFDLGRNETTNITYRK